MEVRNKGVWGLIFGLALATVRTNTVPSLVDVVMLGVHLLKIPSVPDVHDLGMFQDFSATLPTVSLPDYAKVPTVQAPQGYLWGPAPSSQHGYDTLEHRDAVSIELGALLKLQTPVRLISTRGVGPLINSAPLASQVFNVLISLILQFLRCTHAAIVRMLDRQAFLGFIGLRPSQLR